MAQNRSFRTQAIILKRRSMGEADRILTLLTPEHGKIDVTAKGARKPASRKTGHVELFTKADVLVSRGRGDLLILTQAEVIEPFLPLREQLTLGAYANYVAELLDRFAFEGDDLQGLFDLLDGTLRQLCQDEDARRVLRYYELNLLEFAGFRPELQECVITREILLPEEQFFSYDEGGVVSPEGAVHVTGLVGLPVKTLKFLRHVQRNPYKKLTKLKVDEPTHRDAERIMLGYLTYVLEKKLQSVDFIQRLRQLDL
jgi:DNA repair protein RecO (recombination protein O)